MIPIVATVSLQSYNSNSQVSEVGLFSYASRGDERYAEKVLFALLQEGRGPLTPSDQLKTASVLKRTTTFFNDTYGSRARYKEGGTYVLEENVFL
jgi:hypothetical protein